jgi:hypothetical protein
MVGRLFTIEDEIDVLDEELGQARRRLHSLVRAPLEGRWTRDGVAWLDAVGEQENRVRTLERTRAGLVADLIAEAEGFITKQGDERA